MKSIIDSLFRANPMRIEIQRFRRRFLGFAGSSVNNAVLGLIMLGYTGLVMLVVNTRGDLSPVVLIMFQTALFGLLAPAMLHGAIAGERERRTWELLLVAPISKAQIVAGKFMGATTALGIGAVAMGLPIVIAGLSYERTNWWNVLMAESISLSLSMFIAAWTIFISARVKRPFMALGASLGSVILAVLVVPGMVSTLADRITTEALLFFNPFYALGRLEMTWNSSPYENNFIAPGLFGIPHILVYLGFTLLFLVYAEKTLNFADNEIKFMPKGQQNA